MFRLQYKVTKHLFLSRPLLNLHEVVSRHWAIVKLALDQGFSFSRDPGFGMSSFSGSAARQRSQQTSHIQRQSSLYLKYIPTTSTLCADSNINFAAARIAGGNTPKECSLASKDFHKANARVWSQAWSVPSHILSSWC